MYESYSFPRGDKFTALNSENCVFQSKNRSKIFVLHMYASGFVSNSRIALGKSQFNTVHILYLGITGIWLCPSGKSDYPRDPPRPNFSRHPFGLSTINTRFQTVLFSCRQAQYIWRNVTTACTRLWLNVTVFITQFKVQIHGSRPVLHFYFFYFYLSRFKIASCIFQIFIHFWPFCCFVA